MRKCNYIFYRKTKDILLNGNIRTWKNLLANFAILLWSNNEFYGFIQQSIDNFCTISDFSHCQLMNSCFFKLWPDYSFFSPWLIEWLRYFPQLIDEFQVFKITANRQTLQYFSSTDWWNGRFFLFTHYSQISCFSPTY